MLTGGRGKNYGATDAVKGDLFVILGACCYGLSNVLEEFLVSKRPIYEVVGQVRSTHPSPQSIRYPPLFLVIPTYPP